MQKMQLHYSKSSIWDFFFGVGGNCKTVEELTCSILIPSSSRLKLEIKKWNMPVDASDKVEKHRILCKDRDRFKL